MIKTTDIWKSTDGGRTIIEDLIPSSKNIFGTKKKIRIRPDERTPSASLILDTSTGIWYIKDFGSGADSKAKNAITLICEEKALSYVEALHYINNFYLKGQLDNSPNFNVFPEPVITNTGKPLDDIEIKTKDYFTNFELEYLGGSHKNENKTTESRITESYCKDFNLKSVDYYITKKGYKISSTDDYPIYYYDYGSWGKLYQPFSVDYRFIYTGTKPKKEIFSDNKTKSHLEKLYSGISLDLDYDENDKPKKLIKDLIICSGPSDAINVYAEGYHVCWLNSETETIDSYDFNKLKIISENIYYLPDLDSTGKKIALKLGLQFLELRTIWLPEDLRNFHNEKKQQCKDIRDFFKFYRDSKYSSKSFYFQELVRISLSCQFWSKIEKEDGKVEYYISNEHLYNFLNALGIFQIPSKSVKGECVFVQITNNIIEEYNRDSFPSVVNSIIINYLRENLNYYNIGLLNAIHRSAQFKLASLSNIKKITPDIKTYGPDYDFFFFSNCAIKITSNGIETFKTESTGKYIFKEKIIPHNFKLIDNAVDIEYSDNYKKYFQKLNSHEVDSPEYEDASSSIAELKKYHDVFTLKKIDDKFSYIKYLYNTGRVYWKLEAKLNTLSEKEKKELKLNGKPTTLTDLQKREQDLHFISKVAQLGYGLFKYKEKSKTWFGYGMETELTELGMNKGGTGKSFYQDTFKLARTVVAIDGNDDKKLDKRELIFQEVIKDKTDLIIFDDLSRNFDMRSFLTAITGDMEVKHLFVNKYTIPFEESPKMFGTSNHPLKNINPSLRRRIWFTGFSDYYHYEDSEKNLPLRNMFTEFSKNLIQDYTEDEMNQLYNFLAYCLHFYLQVRDKIEPPLENIEKRNLQNIMSDDFINWAENYFGRDINGDFTNLNVTISKETAFNSFIHTITERESKYWKMARFKKCLQTYAQFCDPKLIFNPDDLKNSETELKINEIRVYQDCKDVYCFHYRTHDFKPQNIK